MHGADDRVQLLSAASALGMTNLCAVIVFFTFFKIMETLLFIVFITKSKKPVLNPSYLDVFSALISVVMQHRMLREAQKAMAPWMNGQPIYAPISSNASSQGVPMLYSGERRFHKSMTRLLC